MEKIIEMKLDTQQDNSFTKLIKDFFNPLELWGRQNRNQFMIGLICAAGYFLTNIIFKTDNPDLNPYFHTSSGLYITVFICIGLILSKLIRNIFASSKSPWYEKYMAELITLLGLVTLIALQNLNGAGTLDAALWINTIILLVVFIIAAGYFVEGSGHERVLKLWFALLGYFLSVVAFFYFLET